MLKWLKGLFIKRYKIVFGDEVYVAKKIVSRKNNELTFVNEQNKQVILVGIASTPYRIEKV